LECKGKIIIFIKSSASGQVKTRIARNIGEKNTLLLYRAMVKDLVLNIHSLGNDIIFFEDRNEKAGGEILQEIADYEVRLQRGVDLGERMYNAFLDVFRSGHEKAVLIGTDIPHIDSEMLLGYMVQLDQFPAVIGPSEDGGYYLIGFRSNSLSRDLFEGIAWSTPSVFSLTLQKARGTGIGMYVGEKLRDIDRFEDLETLFRDRTLKARIPHVYGEFEKQLILRNKNNN
jgi:rSAM/selenodomain-associated transferase 1